MYILTFSAITPRFPHGGSEEAYLLGGSEYKDCTVPILPTGLLPFLLHFAGQVIDINKKSPLEMVKPLIIDEL
jgi:hypothetical protein